MRNYSCRSVISQFHIAQQQLDVCHSISMLLTVAVKLFSSHIEAEEFFSNFTGSIFTWILDILHEDRLRWDS